LMHPAESRAIAELEALKKLIAADIEVVREKADLVIVRLLRDMGCRDAARVWRSIPRRYYPFG
jgi:hypothetical protein